MRPQTLGCFSILFVGQCCCAHVCTGMCENYFRSHGSTPETESFEKTIFEKTPVCFLPFLPDEQGLMSVIPGLAIRIAPCPLFSI